MHCAHMALSQWMLPLLVTLPDVNGDRPERERVLGRELVRVDADVGPERAVLCSAQLLLVHLEQPLFETQLDELLNFELVASTNELHEIASSRDCPRSRAS